MFCVQVTPVLKDAEFVVTYAVEADVTSQSAQMTLDACADVMNPESFVSWLVLLGMVGLPVTYDQLTADRYGTSF